MAFLKDPDTDVSEAATMAISSVLNELEDEENAFKAEFISTLLSIDGLCSDDAVESFAGDLESLGAADEKLAVQTIVSLIEDDKTGTSVKKRMKEVYEFVTGDTYTTLAAAEKWWNEKTAEEEAEAAANDENDDSDDDTDDDTNDEQKGGQE